LIDLHHFFSDIEKSRSPLSVVEAKLRLQRILPAA